MSVSHAINAARSGLQVSGLRADIVATNVANATTPGYVRRSALLAETTLGTTTHGVRVAGVDRARDDGLTGQRMLLTSDLSQASLRSSTWQTIASRIGNSTDGPGLFNSLNSFESALKAAAATPESEATANSVLNAARSLVNQLHGLSRMVETQRGEADREIADGVKIVNKALKDIEQLNVEISSNEEASVQVAALKDERQRLLDTISEYIPIETVRRDRGSVDVVTKEGVFLIAGKAQTIDFSPSNSFVASQTVENGQLSGLSVNGTELTPGASAWSALSSGLFGALFTLRDSDLPELSRQLDSVAGDLITRLSADGIDPTTASGAPGLFVDSDPGAGDGLASRIEINAAVDPAAGGQLWRLRDGLAATAEGPPGNNTILSAMVDALTEIRSINENGIQGSFTATQLSAHLSSMVGQTRIAHDSVLASTTAQHTIAFEAEQSLTAVDVDAQMQELLLIEQAYAANARVIQVASQMIQRLMDL